MCTPVCNYRNVLKCDVGFLYGSKMLSPTPEDLKHVVVAIAAVRTGIGLGSLRTAVLNARPNWTVSVKVWKFRCSSINKLIAFRLATAQS